MIIYNWTQRSFCSILLKFCGERTIQGIKLDILEVNKFLLQGLITKKACARSSWATSIPIFLMIFFVLLLFEKHFKTPSNVESFTRLFDLLVRTGNCNIKYIKVVLNSQNLIACNIGIKAGNIKQRRWENQIEQLFC